MKRLAVFNENCNDEEELEEQVEPCKSVCEESLSDKSDDTELSASAQGTLVKGYEQPFNIDNDLSFTFKEGIVYDGFFTEEAIS